MKGLLPLNIGDNVTLQCSYESDDSAWFFWYKQILGEKPKLISSFYVYDTKITFHNEFQDNKHFKLETKEGKNDLHIFHLTVSDSATYYCASSYTFVLSFAEGIILSVRDSDSNVPALVHQSVSGSIQPGGSVTLNCTVQTGTCDGQHSVYWFKDSGEARPGVIYTNGDRNDQCERNPDTQTHTCVYNLPLESLNASHAGTYYCAVASCGQIVFGKGTDIHIKHDVNTSSSLVYYLSGALIFTILMVVSLGLSAYNLSRRNNCHGTEQKARSAPVPANPQGCEEVNSLHYAALGVNSSNRSRKQKSSTQTECVYSGVK
ncbi:uncharacterized protein LOC114844111 isoform X2 [Betta splendens]|nr:uncharacterized protein LOC114844111 isoform X2 [Betta splendens]XP_055360526.1 uncharacterized protein LOC114844111 isoform X2 [Betta splendens]